MSTSRFSAGNSLGLGLMVLGVGFLFAVAVLLLFWSEGDGPLEAGGDGRGLDQVESSSHSPDGARSSTGTGRQEASWAIGDEPGVVEKQEVRRERRPVRRRVAGAGGEQLRGVVLDRASGEPITRFELFCVPAGQGPAHVVARQQPSAGVARQSSTGRFSLGGLEPGAHHLLVVAEGYEDLETEVTLPSSTPVSVRMSRGAQLAGRVLDGAGSAVASIPVFLEPRRIFEDRPPPKDRRCMTDASGAYRFGPLPPGVYQVGLGAALAVTSRDLIVEEDQSVEQDLLLETGNSLRVLVTDVDGVAIEAARVVIWACGSQRSATTDASGEAVLRHLPASESTIRITSGDHRERRETVRIENVGPQEARFTMELRPSRDTEMAVPASIGPGR